MNTDDLKLVENPSEIIKVLGFCELNICDPIVDIGIELDNSELWSVETWDEYYPSPLTGCLIIRCIHGVDCVITTQKERVGDKLDSLITTVTVRYCNGKQLLPQRLLGVGFYKGGEIGNYAYEDSVLLITEALSGEKSSIILTPINANEINMISMKAYTR